MNLILVGYMASGKSTIGENIAKVLNYKFIDLDNYIEKRESLSVSEIFSKKGELYFRKLENASLKEIVENENNYVLSLGGGTPCFYDAMDWLSTKPNTKTIYLKVDLYTLTRRLLKDKTRPLISHLEKEEDIKEFIAKHLFERSYFYNKANFKIDASKDVEEITEHLLFKLF
jgi:shikimate kinase